MRKFLLLLSLLLAVSCSRPREEILKVYNWADYIDEDLIEEFEQWYEEQTGRKVRIVYQLFDINEVMLSKIEMGHEDFDVVCPSDYIIERMLRNDLLLPIDRDFGDTPDYIDANKSPFFTELFSMMDARDGQDANDYVSGYMWGTMGLLYNTKYVSREDLSTWSALGNPGYAGKLFVKDAFRDVYSSLLIYLNHDRVQSGEVSLRNLTYDVSDESIAEVESFMDTFKDNVSGWEADFGKELMTKEAAWINFSWSGDAQWAIDEAARVGVDLDYVVPDEGSIVWFDGWVIPKYAKNPEAARYFINFLCMQENAIRNMDAIGYVSTLGGDIILESQIDSSEYEPVDASYFFGPSATHVCLNPVQYPDRSLVEKCMIMHDSSPDRTKALLEMWNRVKGDNATGFTYIVIIAAMVVLTAGGVRKKIRKHKKHRKF